MKKSLKIQVLITSISSILILAFVVIIAEILDVKIGELTRDPADSIGFDPITGILSNLGILFWCAAGSICLFSSIALRNIIPLKTVLFLHSSSILSIYLLFDDLLLLHERLIPDYLGIDEKVVYLILILCVTIYFFSFRKIILKTRYGFLLLSFAFFMISLFDDILEQYLLISNDYWMQLMEDGSKWLGIACWLSYFVETSYRFMSSVKSKYDFCSNIPNLKTDIKEQ